MAGLLVLVVGPSGAGKDTLITAAKSALAGDLRYVFPRRMVTREAVPQLEDHDTMSWEEFAAGDFALSWEAHGLGYALPHSIEADIAAGRTVIANVSRNVLAEAARRHPAAILVVTADPSVRAARLAGRGRESAVDVAARLAREGTEIPAGLAPVVAVDNSGTLDTAVGAFLAAIRGFSAPRETETHLVRLQRTGSLALKRQPDSMMSRNTLYALIAVLAVVAIGLGVYVYNEQQKPGLSITVDGTGIDIQGNG